MEEKMIMVVFGAGASYDSDPTHRASLGEKIHQRMPLADELFEDRGMFNKVLDKFPQIKPILAHLRRTKYDPSLEQIIQTLYDEAADDPKRHQQLAAIRYYLRDIILRSEDDWMSFTNHTTNHMTLFDDLRPREKDGICLVTFNYDTIIERSLETVGMNIASLEDYLSNNQYKLIKLHGSVNWAHPIEEPHVINYNGSDLNVSHRVIQNINNINVNYDKFSMMNKWTIEVDGYGGGLLFPAIAIPVERKSNYECPSEQLNALQKLIPSVDKILVVGWRASETHFLNLLSANLQNENSNLKCLVVSESDVSSKVTITNLQNAGIKANYKTFDHGFSGFVRTRMIRNEF